MLESVDQITAMWSSHLKIIEAVTTSYFTIELIIFVSAASGEIKQIFTWENIVDFLSICYVRNIIKQHTTSVSLAQSYNFELFVIYSIMVDVENISNISKRRSKFIFDDFVKVHFISNTSFIY